MGRYHYPLPETAAVQSVGLPWLGSGRREAEHARILTADDSRDVALVAEPVIDYILSLLNVFVVCVCMCPRPLCIINHEIIMG